MGGAGNLPAVRGNLPRTPSAQRNRLGCAMRRHAGQVAGRNGQVARSTHMKILALQLKRIGDVILTTPALAALRAVFPQAHISLAVADGCGGLLPAIGAIDRGIVFRRGDINAALLGGLLVGKFDACLDFTGNDRSAFCALLSKARRRVTFAWVRKSKLRALAFNRFVDSPVRDHHTVDHYCHLLHGLGLEAESADLALRIPSHAAENPKVAPHAGCVVIHPGTARPDKYWLPERWAAVISHLRTQHGAECVITGGSDRYERENVKLIQRRLQTPCVELAGKLNLLEFAAVIARARACLSCDTAAVHLAAAFRKPQIALYGPINPFHWRPRHDRAVVISAAHPDEPLTHFEPRMKGAPMEAISTELVIRATDALLAEDSSS